MTQHADQHEAGTASAIGVIVDPETCSLTGYCIRTHPELFEERDGVAVPRVSRIPGTNTQLQASARDAETVCPTGAIVIE